MEATAKNMNSNRGFKSGTISKNFPCEDSKYLGLVRTDSIQSPYILHTQTIGISSGEKQVQIKKLDFY